MPIATGTKLGRYEIRSKIGEGGMGEVYLARETSQLDRTVALKVLPAGLADDTRRISRFIKEAKTVSTLNHPNILTIFEFGEEAGAKFIATEYVEGQTLRKFLSDRRIKLRDILDIAIQIAAALDAAHQKNVVHRDIKPENVMLRRDHIVKVLDFGVAKLTEGFGNQAVDTEAGTKVMADTSPGLLLGTASYMSPEQSRAEKVDHRTDVWSLGVVIYEMVTGRLPFAAADIHRQIIAIQESEVVPLSTYVEGIPDRLDDIVSKALEKKPDERYQTAKDLLLDLKRLRHRLEVDSEIERTVAPDLRGTTGGSEKMVSHHPEIAKAAQTSNVRSVSSAEYLINAARARPQRVLIVLAFLFVAGVLATWFFYFHRAGGSLDSVAVLPFDNTTGDVNTEYLADGIAETLINSLTRLQQLRVVARTTAFRYKGKEIEPQTIGRELNVRAVLTGRVRLTGDLLDVQVDLVDTNTGAQLWGEEYERPMSDVLTVKQEIAREITEKLKLTLTGEQKQQLTKQDTTSSEAYQFYLRGRYYWNKRTAEGIKRAVQEFQHATEHDPNYALAYVGLTDCYVIAEEYASVPWSESRQQATEAIERALRLDNSLAETHASLAMVKRQSWQWAEAEDEFKRAITLNPNYPTVHHWYSVHLRTQGRLDESMREIRRAQELDPLSPVIQVNIVSELMAKGELETAVAVCRKLIDFDPNYPLAHGYLGWLYQAQGQYDPALSELQKWVELSGRQSEPLGSLAQVQALAGHRDKALGILKELEERYTRRETNALPIASVYAGLRDFDLCFAWLEKDFQARSGMLSYIGYRPTFDLIRSDPRYSSLLQRMGIKQQALPQTRR